MTANSTSGSRWARSTTLAAGLLTLPLAAGCADDPSPAEDQPAAKSPALSVDAACPEGLTAGDLGDSVDYDRADVDGDGKADAISIGTVRGGGAACRAALVVTTAAGTTAAALPQLEVVPPRGFVPGGTATVGEQSVLAAPVSFSPRGGGEVGLFTLVDGVLTPVQDGSGDPWTIVATVDDAGGVPQSIDCTGGGLSHTVAVSDPLDGAIKMRLTRYHLEGAELSQTGGSTSTMYPRDTPDGTPDGSGPPRRGLSIFASC